MRTPRNATRLHLLTVREVQTASAGDHSDGGGLQLRITETAASWVLRYTAPSGKRREMGLGAVERNNPAAAGRSLSAARQRAHEARACLAQGLDPIDEREARRRAAKEAAAAKVAEQKRERLTLARVARDYHERVIEGARSDKHAAQWIASLENHVPQSLWLKPIADIEAPELLDVMADLQAKVPETASRVRQRLEAIFDDAVFRKLCAGNPASAIRRKLREHQKGRTRTSFAALPFTKAPAFLAQLRSIEGIAARCLEFTCLTAARTNEAIEAEWSEFDLEGGIWTVPPGRMKARERHIVYLSPRAVEILSAPHRLHDRYVFPSPSGNGKPLSNMALLMQLRRLKVATETTVHGLRSTFSTWAYENAMARPDVIEACLAHKEQDRVRAAYNRAQFAIERKGLMAAWSRFLDGEAVPSTVELRLAA